MSSEKTYAQQAPGSTGADRNHPAEQGYRVEIIDAAAGLVKAIPAPRQKFAICGFAASSRHLAPWDNPEYEVWGMNQLYRHIPRATRWFDIHANWRDDNVPGTDHPQWLAECGIPVYMTQLEPSVPTSVAYPVQAVMDRVSGLDYFTSSVAFMLALAIYEIDQQVDAELAMQQAGEATVADVRQRVTQAYERREIGIWGIDLIVGTEYDWQKACVEYYLGLAQARGIHIRIPQFSALLRQQWRYGFEREAQAWPIRDTELRRRHEAIQKERDQAFARLQMLDGALQENGYWRQVADLRLKGGTIRLNEDS